MGKPKAPDPYKTAAAQGAMNRETAITEFGLNAVTQDNPWGSVAYEQTGTWEDGTPRFTQTTTLSDAQQGIFDKTQAAQDNLAGIAESQSGFLGEYLNDPFQFDNQAAEDWAFDLGSRRIQPQQAAAQEATLARLANSGIRPGSAAYDAEMTRLSNAQNDQWNQLALNGRGMAFQEAMATRNQPINEITALMSGSQVSNPAQMSNPAPQSNVAGVDLAGMVQNKYNADLAQAQGTWGGIGGLFGTVGTLFSDRRLKTDIRRVGTTDAGVPIFTYRYVWGGPVHMGVMAQDVPDAAVMTPSGFLAVDYAEVR